MLTRLRLRNFKSWSDTGDIALRPITAFFGANSSGKTSLLQSLLLLKQTAESSDRGRVLHFGGRRTLVDLGDFDAVVRGHETRAAIGVELDWEVPQSAITEDGRPLTPLTDIIGYFVSVDRNGSRGSVSVQQMGYRVGEARFRMRRQGEGYGLVADGAPFDLERRHQLVRPLPPPIHCYGFPHETNTHFKRVNFLPELVHSLVQQLDRIHYLGPLRAPPERRYIWTGSRPDGVGRAGETAMEALLASREREDLLSLDSGEKWSLETIVARHLLDMGLIHSFRVETLGQGSQVFRVLVRESADSAEVPITDVGFGVSQVLPVLVLCFYAPRNSTIILEQPDIHLHPAVQSRLADVLIAAAEQRNVQILIESHSEDLLTRFQRRVADESLSEEKLGLWFCESDAGVSRISRLRMDDYGNVANWPKDFFGDEFGEIAEITEQQERRKAGR